MPNMPPQPSTRREWTNGDAKGRERERNNTKRREWKDGSCWSLLSEARPPHHTPYLTTLPIIDRHLTILVALSLNTLSAINRDRLFSPGQENLNDQHQHERGRTWWVGQGEISPTVSQNVTMKISLLNHSQLRNITL